MDVPPPSYEESKLPQYSTATAPTNPLPYPGATTTYAHPAGYAPQVPQAQIINVTSGKHPAAIVPPYSTATTMVIVPAYVQVHTRYPETLTCPHCHQCVTTEVDYECGLGAWLIALFVVACVCCCDCVKDAVHKCPNCHRNIGRKNLIG